MVPTNYATTSSGAFFDALVDVGPAFEMSDLEGIKAFVYTWLHKNHRKVPEYSFQQRSAGRGRWRFICELRVNGFNYVGVGNSTSKKDAQTNAARDFASFLVREGLLKEADVPVIKKEEYSMASESPTRSTIQPSTSSQIPPAPGCVGGAGSANDTSDSYINRIMDKVKLEEAEGVDFTTDIHGGWSMENSKARLNEYLQVTRQPPVSVKYTGTGPDHNRSFLAEATVRAARANKILYARESGSNKTVASRACCLSLVRQLFHIGEIEAYTGERRKKHSEEVPPIEVHLQPDLESRLGAVLEQLHLVPNTRPPQAAEMEGEELNMIATYQVVDFGTIPRQGAQLMAWCPPIPNWSPWTGCNIDEGPEALMSLAQLSRMYLEQYQECTKSAAYALIRDERNSLPVAVYTNQILETITRHQVTLIKGETGCGKTTQIPQFILDHFISRGRGAECAVLVTQQRRIGAVSLAERVASERCEALGVSVGYAVRFEAVLPRAHGAVLFCTVGNLCRRLESGLRGVSHIVVDDIHERDVNTDFMLILLRDLIRANPQLRVVLMSATIDTRTFTEYFDNVATVELEGRTHPVTTYYLEDCIKMTHYEAEKQPEVLSRRAKKSRNQTDEDEAIAAATEADENCNLVCPPDYPPFVAESMRLIPEKEVPYSLIGALLEHICEMGIGGAVLIFLPGWNTISTLKRYLLAHRRFGNPHDFLILPLHSQVPKEDQRLVFRSTLPGVRKIVLATNIAESSITINDVVFVVDTCLAHIKLFTARNNLTSFSTVWASRTSLEQRRGRAGRVRAGFAFQLCSRARAARLEVHSTPEILRTPLHELALLIKLLRLGDVGDFLLKAIQSPPLDAVAEAQHTLRELKALDTNDELTPLGRILARLPLEPRLGRMLVWSCVLWPELGLGGGVLPVMAAHAAFGCDLLSMPPDRHRLSPRQLRLFASAVPHSDHLAALSAFQAWAASRAHRRDESEEADCRWCEEMELNLYSLRMVDDAATQIRKILLNMGFSESVMDGPPVNFRDSTSPAFDCIAAMLTGAFYPNMAFHVDKRKLLTAEGKCALVHKSSVICVKKPAFPSRLFVFNEKIRTQAIKCKVLTMVTPIHVMLFGCRKAVWKPDSTNGRGSDEGVVLVDDWLPFRMRYSAAARLFALRPALEALLVRVCLEPCCAEELTPDDKSLIDLTKDLCQQAALGYVAERDEPNPAGNESYADQQPSSLLRPHGNQRSHQRLTEPQSLVVPAVYAPTRSGELMAYNDHPHPPPYPPRYRGVCAGADGGEGYRMPANSPHHNFEPGPRSPYPPAQSIHYGGAGARGIKRDYPWPEEYLPSGHRSHYVPDQRGHPAWQLRSSQCEPPSRFPGGRYNPNGRPGNGSYQPSFYPRPPPPGYNPWGDEHYPRY